jgi:Sec-independent protein translocase protein TatA
MSDVALVLVAVLIVVLVWRGPKTLPELGKALGRGIREARREAGGEDEDGEATSDGPDRPDA